VNNYSRFMKALDRRADHLGKRVAEARAKGKENSYDVTELAALNWAIRQLEGQHSATPSSGRP
jgi:hypothetical protein